MQITVSPSGEFDFSDVVAALDEQRLISRRDLFVCLLSEIRKTKNQETRQALLRVWFHTLDAQTH